MDPSLPGIEHVDAGLVRRLDSALRDKEAGYTPRTRHHVDGRPAYTNRLILETSPYLLQHAHNPVNWFPWGDEAFERARREDKLVLLSIGYSTCHWCHVMEQESFEDPEIAAVINARFVPIKVDREERPDVDSVYMTTVQMMTGQGGWPMTVILLPDRRPIFGGTYFPARDGDRGARVGFLSLLQEIDRRYRANRAAFTEHAESVVEHLRAGVEETAAGELPGEQALAAAAHDFGRRFDPTWGGFGAASKFPRGEVLELLARHHVRTGDAHAREMLVTTLEKMAAGGIYDHVGGGFHRYSVDAAWLVPHFEKMLYDNAQLAVSYLEGHQLTGREDFARVARETLEYLAREMRHPDGGFFSATDADSLTPDGRREEGWFFTWTPRELDAVLAAKQARYAMAYYAMSAEGSFEGRNVLHAPRPLDQVAGELGTSPEDLEGTLREARALLYAARAQRPAPLRDDKIIAAWNGLAVSAFARGGFVLDEPRYLEIAESAARFVLERMWVGGRLLRTWRDGSARHAGVLDDYAFVIQGLIDLYEVTGRWRWLEEARRLQGVLDEHFWDGAAGGYFLTSDEHEALLVRAKPDYDGAEPAGNSVALASLVRLERLTDDAAYGERARLGLAAFAANLSRAGITVPRMLCALDLATSQPRELVIVGPSRAQLEPMLAVVRPRFLPTTVLCLADEAAGLADHARAVPLLAGKRPRSGAATAYVCVGRACRAPTTDPQELSKQL